MRTGGRGFRGEVVMGVLEEGGGPDEVIVIVDIVGGCDEGGGSVGGGCGALMEEGLGEAVDIGLDDADSQDNDGRG